MQLFEPHSHTAGSDATWSRRLPPTSARRCSTSRSAGGSMRPPIAPSIWVTSGSRSFYPRSDSRWSPATQPIASTAPRSWLRQIWSWRFVRSPSSRSHHGVEASRRSTPCSSSSASRARSTDQQRKRSYPGSSPRKIFRMPSHGRPQRGRSRPSSAPRSAAFSTAQKMDHVSCSS